VRNVFVGAQVTGAVTLLLVGMLFARSLQEGLDTDIGFTAEGVVAATIDLAAPFEYDRATGRAFFDALLARVSDMPGVQSIALTQYVPLSGKWRADRLPRRMSRARPR
jgi:hypothetical protein